MSQKLKFWSVFALVTGSQIGTGIFVLPTSLAPFGVFGLFGWVVSSFGAINLALLFAILCHKFPKTGGPHVYIQAAFGQRAAFFTGWTYWIISWVSTTAVVIAAVGYLSPLIGDQSNSVRLGLEVLLLLTITALNLKGTAIAGRAEFILTILKFVPLLIVGLCALSLFDINNFTIEPEIRDLSFSQIMGKVTLLTFWGFIGIECATTSAGSVVNPGRTIPRAIVLGTLCVSVLYLINCIGIMGMIPGKKLMYSSAAYVDAAQLIFGGQWHFIISLVAAIICIGTLNAWVLTSGQIALGLAEDKLMPKLFGKKNKNDAPSFGIILSCIGMIPLLVLTAHENLADQITLIIDFSVTAFLFVYLICSLSFLKLLFNSSYSIPYYHWLIGIFSIIFCTWVIYETSIKTLLVASIFTFSGLPIYWFWYCKNPTKIKNL